MAVLPPCQDPLNIPAGPSPLPGPLEHEPASFLFPTRRTDNLALASTVFPKRVALHLLEKITNDFSKDRELGSGAYGKVYKGVHKNGETMAVKLFHSMAGLDDERFEEEFHNIARLQHKNIVRLVGFCHETQRKIVPHDGKMIFADSKYMALCFEYMHNGSLDKYIFDEYSGHDWSTRYAIIKGICEGLKYLHEELNPPIYHLDLKPANILLDDNMMPKLADFGLSKIFEQERTRITESCIGTRGYLPPEYIDRNVISNKLDIFSLGVIIIKIISGPTGRTQCAEMPSKQFVELVHEKWRNRLQKTLVDAAALETYSEQVMICIEIALSCVETDRYKRPDIGAIIDKLNKMETKTDQVSVKRKERKAETHKQKMSVTLLSDVQPRRLDYTICVRISRMWEYRGPNEENEIIHLDLVLIDSMGVPIYAEVPRDAVPYLKPYLEEGKIVYMSKITVQTAKPEYRPVEHSCMIKLNKRTQIPDAHDQPPDFPKYTFSLIPIEKLPDYAKSKERFLDVIGKITGVSNAVMICTNSGDSMMRRVVHLQDLKGSTIKLSLSGKKATEFDGETVLQVGQKHHVIAIFVGTLMKIYNNDYKFLSGTSACRWYINQNDIPEIKAFQRCLPAEAIPIQKLYLQGGDDTQQNFEKRTMLQLKDVDPFTERAINYECTATIVGITEQQTWCYQACKACKSRIKSFGQTYQCTKKDCPSIQFEWKYKIPYIASDETYSLEFMFFEKKGTKLIGKSAETLRKKYNEKDIPPEISSWIGHKFTFLVKILPNKSIGADDPSFEVIRIKEKLGKQPIMPVSKAGKNKPAISSSAYEEKEENLPLLIDGQASSSQAQSSRGIQDMEIEQTGDDSDNSSKINTQGIQADNLEINEENEDKQQRKPKKPRLQEKTKH